MKRKIAVTVVLMLGGLGSISYPQSQDDIAKQFVGMWRLVSWQQRLADGTTRQNPQSVGYIIYTDTNRMCVVALDPDRPKWKSVTAPTDAEAMSAIRGLLAYCASVEIHAKEGFILHHIEIGKVPNRVGLTRKRWFAFHGAESSRVADRHVRTKPSGCREHADLGTR